MALDLHSCIQRGAGIAPGALAAIAADNWAQFAAVVLKRSLVEAVGGFHPSLIHAADWDFWKRAALHQPVAYEPTVLACYRIFEGNDTSRLIKTGANVADLRPCHRAERRISTIPRIRGLAAGGSRNFWPMVRRLNAINMLLNGDHDAFENNSARLAASTLLSFGRTGILNCVTGPRR